MEKKRENEYHRHHEQANIVEEILPDQREPREIREERMEKPKKRVSSPPKKHRHEETDVNLTEDEMSVNSINK